MRDYNRIIESLSVKLIKAKNIEIIKAVVVEDVYDVENVLIIANKGTVAYDKGGNKITLEKGDILFVPEGKLISQSYGSNASVTLNSDQFISNRSDYLKSIDKPSPNADFENFSFIKFEAKIFESVNFFGSLDIPPFIIRNNKKVVSIMKTLLEENSSEREGANRLVGLNMDYLVIEIIRHILDNELFVEKLATNSNYFRDIRLINILKYIKANLNKDLSNKVLASVAKVSEDYVGQYFKMLTGINPQDYIEYQRMEKAVKLLRTGKKSIREIGAEVGFKDTAYFCRRFKMMFGIPAGKMRRRETLAEV
ncbi:MAG: helix-turn-helix transcriptional regulator [Bacteroidetes bacterium]|nr:helix-turn-helix transcriptional regulator [Bacteroidota bacterium]